MVEARRRNRIVDAVLLGLIIVAASWLGSLVYHNFLGGHVALEFADWTIPVPEGTRIVEYAAVPIEERTERIELVRDLVIGGYGDDPNTAFYNAHDLAVAADGRVYVHDNGNHRIQVFDAEGTFVRTIGREGEGPGEIGGGGELEITGDKLIRSGDRRLSAWTLDGEFLGDVQVEDGKRLMLPTAFDDGSLLAGYMGGRLEDQPMYVRLVNVVRVSPEGTLVRDYAALRQASALFTLSAGAGSIFVQIPGEAPGFVATADGSIYLTPGGEYQVLALDGDGAPRWALRVASSRVPFNDAHKEAAILKRPEDSDVVNIDDYVQWPELNPALANDSRLGGHRPLGLDGRANVYVFPWVEKDEDRDAWPVDIYSPEGERLFAGLIPIDHWIAALGEFIYRFEEHPETGEQQVVRYRLVEPFE